MITCASIASRKSWRTNQDYEFPHLEMVLGISPSLYFFIGETEWRLKDMADDYHLTKTYCALDHEIICDARKICGRCRVSINHKLEEAPAAADATPLTKSQKYGGNACLDEGDV